MEKFDPLTKSLLSSFLLTTVLIGFTAGCGSSGNGFSGNTTLTLLGTSTANDQLSEFALSLQSLTLKNQSGEAVNLIGSSGVAAEFIHLNGSAEPLATISIPQGIYSSATATVGDAQFECATLDPTTGGIDTSTFSYGQTPSSQVTVTLPEPITITGSAMGLALNLLVSKSANYQTCDPTGGVQVYSINPTFTLTQVTLSSQPTNISNGKLSGISGIVTSIAGSTMSVTGNDFSVWSADTGNTTVFQGISGASSLAAGMQINVDANIQNDGSLLATRIVVPDSSTTNLSVVNGPVLYVNNYWPIIDTLGSEQQGYLTTSIGYSIGGEVFSFGTAAFQVSGQLSNLQSLPFTPSFTATNMVAGQDVTITTHQTSFESPPIYYAGTTFTLVPQTINGTISVISTQGNFTTYTVTLAPYDLFPTMAVQGGQTTLLSSPNQIVVYADSNTQMLNTTSLAVGNVMRFNGLIFNDNGTLRMDCAQINDGVTE